MMAALESNGRVLADCATAGGESRVEESRAEESRAALATAKEGEQEPRAAALPLVVYVPGAVGSPGEEERVGVPGRHYDPCELWVQQAESWSQR